MTLSPNIVIFLRYKGLGLILVRFLYYCEAMPKKSNLKGGNINFGSRFH
jgi:hypothetical protein